HDPSGTMVVGARVTVRSRATGYQRIVTAGGSGDFVVPSLPPDDYEVKIEATGFGMLILPNVRVRVTETTSLNATLAIGPASEAVTVTATAQIQRDGPQLGRLVEGSATTALPLATRNFTQILTLSPGTSSYLTDSTGVGRNTQLISVNGARVTQND